MIAASMFLGSITKSKAILLHASLREFQVVTPFDISFMMLSSG